MSKTRKAYRHPKSVFITGASSGLGRALAIAYAEKGMTLFICGRNADGLDVTAAACRAQKAVVHPYIFDVNNALEATSAINDANRTKPIDLVIANAGVSGGVLGTRENALSTQQILKTNIFGVVNTILPSIDIMRQNGGGQLAIISSISGYRGMSSCPAYSASKACVKAWGEGLRGFLKPARIAVSVICPGFIETPMTDKNQFKMPFIMRPEKAAAIIRRRLTRAPAIIAFPRIMAFGAWLVSILPACVAHPIMDLFPRKEK